MRPDFEDASGSNLLPQVNIVKFRRGSFIVSALVGLLAIAETIAAQSSDQNLPTAVLSNEINGAIAALDVGDPRLTRHFYAFTGVPGDLMITLDSKNLNGDMDIFTAVTFKPVMKITMYASSLSPKVTKSLYLRSRQILILRVEARTPNDDEGTYRIQFGGAFEPFTGGIPVAETTESSSAIGRSTSPKTKRLSSVGATIEEPVSQASTGTEPTSPKIEKPVEKPATETAANNAPAKKVTKPKTTASPTTRPARNPGRRTTRNKPAATRTEASKIEKAEAPATEPAKAETGEEKPASVPTEKASTTEKPAAQETVTPQPGAHLIIEEKDGNRIDRPMTTVRRVVIENGVIVIVLKNGRVERIPMSKVTRMSIEP